VTTPLALVSGVLKSSIVIVEKCTNTPSLGGSLATVDLLD
jgi:hypothetical protein